MIARITTSLSTNAERVFAAVQKTGTFLYITRGMLGFSGANKWPATFDEGDELQTRMWFFHVIPGWRHYLRLVSVDPAEMELHSNEHGGPIRKWNHRIKIEPATESSCHYLDEIDIEAGILTPLIWLYAHVFYRYRQRRWRRLAATALSH
jgi:hypothetical protein